MESRPYKSIAPRFQPTFAADIYEQLNICTMNKWLIIGTGLCVTWSLSAQEAITDSVSLQEVEVKASAVIRKTDRQILFPSHEQISRSADALELTSRLALPRLMVDPVSKSISLPKGNLQLRINGFLATVQEVATLSPQEIRRVEYHDRPSLRYGEDVNAVINYITYHRSNGGNLNLDLNHQLNTFWMADNLSGKYNRSKSEFSFSTFANGHRYTEFWKDITETFHSPEENWTRRQEGIPSNDYEMYWNTSAGYSWADGELQLFNARISCLYYNYPHQHGRANLTSTRQEEPLPMTDDIRHQQKRPSLDLYYYRKLPHKQSLVFNLVGTYAWTDEKRLYQEGERPHLTTDLSTRSGGNRYSLISEGIYEKELEKGHISAGLKHTQAFTHNQYDNRSHYDTRMREAESYLYGHYYGEWKQWNYNIGIGLSRNHLQQIGNQSYNRWYVRPTLGISYSPNRLLTFDYRYTLRNQNPSLAQLSDVEQPIDSIQVRRGNPLLHPWLAHNHSWEITFNSARIRGGFYVSFQHQPQAVMEETRYDDTRGLFIRTYDNQRSFRTWDIEPYLTWSPFEAYLQINASAGIDRHVSSGHQYRHTYTDFYYMLSMTSDIKRFTLRLLFYDRTHSFWGESIESADSFNSLTVQYRLNDKIKFGTSFATPFYSTVARYRNKNLSAEAPYVSEMRIGDLYPSIKFTFTYRIQFGKRLKTATRSLYNGDQTDNLLKGNKN